MTWLDVLEWSLFVPERADAVAFVEAQRQQDGVLAWRVIHAHGRLTRGRSILTTARWWIGQAYFPYDAETNLKGVRRPWRLNELWRFDKHGVIRWRPVTDSFLAQCQYEYSLRARTALLDTRANLSV